MTKPISKEVRMMRILINNIRHARECSKKSSITPHNRRLWLAVAAQMENLRKRYEALG